MTPTRAKIIDSGLAVLTFSIDGASKDVYEKIRIRGDFDQVVANIRALSELKARLGAERPSLKACYVIMEQNYHEIPDFVALAKDIGISEVIFWPENETGVTLPKAAVEALLDRAVAVGAERGVAVNRHACAFPDEGPDPTALRQHIAEYHRRVGTIIRSRGEFCPDGANDIEYVDEGGIPGGGGRDDAYCPYMETMLIEHSGDINPCCSYWNDYTLRLPQRFGNLTRQSVAEIWSSRTYISFRRKVIQQDWPVICRNCNARVPRQG